MDAPCPLCDGTGFEIRTRPDGLTAAAECECGRKGRGESLLRAARIPRRYDHCSLDAFEIHDASHEAALRIAREWVERWPDRTEQGLLFLGEPGTGKTHLAVGIARDLVRVKGAKVLFYEQRQLLKDLQATFDAGAGVGHISASTASVSRMLSHSTSRKCSATCFQLGVCSL